MLERVTATNGDGLRLSDIMVQYNPNLQSIGLGLEPKKEHESGGLSNYHFLDAIYGNKKTQIEIGRIFHSRFKELGIENIATGENGEDWYDEVGRAILDAVSGSSSDASLWTWLDRPAVNRLIRLLRKARTSSFGKDE